MRHYAPMLANVLLFHPCIQADLIQGPRVQASKGRQNTNIEYVCSPNASLLERRSSIEVCNLGFSVNTALHSRAIETNAKQEQSDQKFGGSSFSMSRTRVRESGSDFGLTLRRTQNRLKGVTQHQK